MLTATVIKHPLPLQLPRDGTIANTYTQIFCYSPRHIHPCYVVHACPALGRCPSGPVQIRTARGGPERPSVCRCGEARTALSARGGSNAGRRFGHRSWFLRPTVLKLGSWSALVLEFSLGVLIWVKEFRYMLLTLGLLFHLWLEYSLNITMFQWDVLSAYVLFIDPADMPRFWRWTRRASILMRINLRNKVCCKRLENLSRPAMR